MCVLQFVCDAGEGAEEDEEEEDHARWCRSKNKNPTQFCGEKTRLRSVFSTSHPNMTTSNKAKSIVAKPTTSVSVSLCESSEALASLDGITFTS